MATTAEISLANIMTPHGLPEAAAGVWNQMVASGEYGPEQAQLLELAARAHADWQSIRDAIGEQWAVLEDGQVLEHPLAKAEREMAQRSKELQVLLERSRKQQQRQSRTFRYSA